MTLTIALLALGFLQEGAALPLLAPDLVVERREVRIEAGDVTLAATLYLPPGVQRPCPAVVQLHGSAPTVREQQWWYYTRVALNAGLAVLAYDKRGCGESTGSRLRFSVKTSPALLDELAGDAAAAHAWLRRQPGIDPERVGLIGGSQAGWIMPLVAERTEGVRFIVSGCGPTVSAGEEQFHERILAKGRSLAEADQALEEWDGARGYDPRALLGRIETPILWLFGERDDVIPTRACLAELAKLHGRGRTNHAVHVFADADHDFETSNGERALLVPVVRIWLSKLGVLD